jgi:hypothetical protein
MRPRHRAVRFALRRSLPGERVTSYRTFRRRYCGVPALARRGNPRTFRTAPRAKFQILTRPSVRLCIADDLLPDEVGGRLKMWREFYPR